MKQSAKANALLRLWIVLEYLIRKLDEVEAVRVFVEPIPRGKINNALNVLFNKRATTTNGLYHSWLLAGYIEDASRSYKRVGRNWSDTEMIKLTHQAFSDIVLTWEKHRHVIYGTAMLQLDGLKQESIEVSDKKEKDTKN